jgi:D-amino-acid dehydrogenase
MRTSFANGGQISASNSEVWNSWSNVIKGIKWMFKKDAPLLFKPWRLDLAMWRWILRFLWYTAKGVGAQNTASTVRMAIESRKLYDEICEDKALEHAMFNRVDGGILHFYKNQTYWDNATDVIELYNANGLDRKIVDDVKAIDPALKDISGVIGATYTPSDWTGDIHKFCYLLAEFLQRQNNVLFFYNWKINDIQSLSETYDAVVIANGVGSVELAKQLREDIGIYPVKGYSITINNVDPKYLPKVSLLDDEAKIVTSSLGNKFRVAGTAELAGENYDISRDRIEPLLNWVHTNFPEINTHDYTQWACLRPMTPNMMPVVRQSKTNSKVFYNTGHGHLGWTLAPVTAKNITNQIKQVLK